MEINQSQIVTYQTANRKATDIFKIYKNSLKKSLYFFLHLNKYFSQKDHNAQFWGFSYGP